METEKQDKLDLIHIFHVLWNSKMAFLISCPIAVIIGVIISFSIPPTYTSTVVLAPEIEGAGGNLADNLSNLASMAGIDIGNGGKSSVDAIYPELYPKIINSTPFLKDLLQVKINTKYGTIKDKTLYEYLSKYQKAPWWSKIAGLFKKKSLVKQGKLDPTKINLFEPTKDQDAILSALKGSIDCSVDAKNSVITITTTTQDPLVSALLANAVQKSIQLYITDYRTKKARNDLAYAEKLLREALNEYKKSQNKYVAYADANEDVLLQSFVVKRDEMENNMQLRYNIYNNLLQQVQTARAKVQERTPAFTQIQPSSVPLLKSAPKRMTIVIAFLFAAIVITTIIVLARDARQAA